MKKEMTVFLKNNLILTIQKRYSNPFPYIRF